MWKAGQRILQQEEKRRGLGEIMMEEEIFSSLEFASWNNQTQKTMVGTGMLEAVLSSKHLPSEMSPVQLGPFSFAKSSLLYTILLVVLVLSSKHRHNSTSLLQLPEWPVPRQQPLSVDSLSVPLLKRPTLTSPPGGIFLMMVSACCQHCDKALI